MSHWRGNGWSLGKLIAVLALCSTPLFSATPSETVNSLLDSSRTCSGDLCRFQAIEKALAINPHSADALRALGEYYVSREQYIAARTEFTAALSADPNDWRSRKQIADLDLRDENTD